jgi:hypothetical protein
VSALKEASRILMGIFSTPPIANIKRTLIRVSILAVTSTLCE